MGLKKRSHRFGLIFYFRFLLWWGKETAIHALAIHKKNAKIYIIVNSESFFSSSLWFFKNDQGYCISYAEQEHTASIFALPKLGSN